MGFVGIQTGFGLLHVISGTLFFDVFIPLEDLKSDWSIMKAYEALQKKGEDDNEDSGNFTPFPVEVLGLM
ncbi:hypothetical protein L2E82_37404 [Cichorium intybus]|uniref:Uncharacterized protein n=1 Tax=Cichorium intybus TaxID=13427 RepID=A0ACB9ADE1_CICIN|nr:hypothetical protein L2E82_37404 [Cichorium intybus]